MSVSGTPTSGTETRPASTTDTFVPEPLEQARSEVKRETGTWNVGWLSGWQAKVLTVLGFAVPAVVYLIFIQHYQVNALWQDQWDDVPVIRQSFVHFPDWSSLWTQHVDNRLLFPNLIMLGLVHTVHYNITVELYLSVLLLFGATALLIWSHQRRSPGTPLLYYCPVAFLTLTLTQYQNMFWGFQMAWYLILFALALAIFVLDRPSLGWPTFLAAVLIAVVGSFSSLQGLLIWPVGLILLYHRRRQLWTFIGWVVAAGGTTALYFHNFNHNNPSFNLHYFFRAPVGFFRFFVLALGNVVGIQEGQFQAPNAAVMGFGIVILALALFVVVKWGIRRDDETAAPIGVALIVFGLLFAGLITQGRFWQGSLGATASRYTTYDVLVVVGIYMAVLGGVSSHARVKAEVVQRDHWWRSHREFVWIRRQIARIDRRVILRLALVVIVIQVVFGVHDALPQIRQFHSIFLNAQNVTAHIRHEPDSAVSGALYFVRTPSWLRAETLFLQQHHLGPFG